MHIYHITTFYYCQLFFEKNKKYFYQNYLDLSQAVKEKYNILKTILIIYSKIGIKAININSFQPLQTVFIVI